MKKEIIFSVFLVLLFVNCSKEPKYELKIPKKTIELHFQETTGINATSNSGNEITYTTKNELIATVDSNGIIEGGVVGDTEIIVSDKVNTEKVKVKIVPKYNTFEEPLLNFNSTRSEVKKFHDKGSAEKIVEDEKAIGIRYNNYFTIYVFEKGKIKLSTIFFEISKFNTDDIVGFLVERYVLVERSDDKTEYYFLTKDKKMVVLLEVDYPESRISYIEKSSLSQREIRTVKDDIQLLLPRNLSIK